MPTAPSLATIGVVVMTQMDRPIMIHNAEPHSIQPPRATQDTTRHRRVLREANHGIHLNAMDRDRNLMSKGQEATGDCRDSPSFSRLDVDPHRFGVQSLENAKRSAGIQTGQETCLLCAEPENDGKQYAIPVFVLIRCPKAEFCHRYQPPQ